LQKTAAMERAGFLKIAVFTAPSYRNGTLTKIDLANPGGCELGIGRLIKYKYKYAAVLVSARMGPLAGEFQTNLAVKQGL